MRQTAGQQHRSNMASRGLSWKTASGPQVGTVTTVGTKPSARSARVKHRNTRESDACPVVAIIITLSDNTEIEVMASDPLAAITDYNRHGPAGS
jgi:hypothetical protein